jgi:hypothetical protein
MKYLFELQETFVGTASIQIGEILGHLALPSGIDILRCHLAQRLLQIVRFQIANQQAVFAQEQRIVAPACLSQGIEHLGPHITVPLLVLVQAIGFYLKQETYSLHKLQLACARNEICKRYQLD